MRSRESAPQKGATMPIIDIVILLVAAGTNLVLLVAVLIKLDTVQRKPDAVTQHHMAVSAVVEMIRQLDTAEPDALKALEQYPEQVRAAAWVHYINTLGASLKEAQDYLAYCHKTYRSPGSPTIREAQTKVDSLRARLDAAVEASGQRRRLRTI